MNLPVDIDYDEIGQIPEEHVVFVIDAQEGLGVAVPHGLIITHDKEKKVIQVPESFAIRQGLI